MLKNPFRKRKSISQKLGDAIHIPGNNHSKKEQWAMKLQNTFLYISLFLAGYIIAKLQMIMK